MIFKKSINCILRLFALVAIVLALVPTPGNCAARTGSDAMAVSAAHSCCAPVAAICDSPAVSNECCCKPVPLNRAATPGLIATPSTQFVQIAVVPPTPMPGSYTQAIVTRENVALSASPPKIYIIHRALLI
jgi:hypothetical protein